ncbi:MAG: ZIP family metal transporter [Planctomycetota bacterium]
MNASLVQAACVLIAVSAIGATLPLYRHWSERGLHIFAAIAAGIFLGVIFLHLLPELSASTGGLLPWAAALGGLVLLFFIERIWLAGRKAAGGDQHDVVWFATFIGLSVHSFATGLGFASIAADPALAWAFVGSIAVHKAGEAFSLATVMRLGHLEVRRAAPVLLAFCLATPAGLFAGSWLTQGDSGGQFTPLLTGLACGTFLYVAVADLLPEVFHATKDPWPRIAGLFFGIAVAAAGATQFH